jgi:hypothetical protein
MMYFFIFAGILVLYFGIRIWIGSRKMEFYGDSINKTKNRRDEAYENSAQHSRQAMNANNQSGGGGPTGGGKLIFFHLFCCLPCH